MPTLKNQGIEIHYEVQGEGTPLVLLHQATDSLEYWIRNGYAVRLRGEFRLILIDLRGFGRSSKPYDPADYHVVRSAEDVGLILDRLRIEAAQLWGYSMGGGIAMAFAHLFPGRTKALVIGGATPQKVRSRFVNQLREGFELAVVHGADRMIEYFNEHWGGLTPGGESRFRQLDFRALLAYIEGIEQRPDLTDALSSMTMPALLYAGGNDVTPMKYMPLAAERMPNGRFISFPGFTHGTMSLEAEAILEHVLPFLRETR